MGEKRCDIIGQILSLRLYSERKRQTVVAAFGRCRYMITGVFSKTRDILFRGWIIHEHLAGCRGSGQQIFGHNDRLRAGKSARINTVSHK
ncbi:hypothetical protein ANACOL_00090 [Anaerotruncus colihominis DSM 17241]|uniref:Uncharacterized protein n=1 Tax=Anaerotruncus colihominis DSM 17241 TaxID=445972 RepID=B0P5R9_9FIRM|nr:hypothetical protein ANACOL_00090 [Anaerotruncus colihominis DSM 17241]